MLCEKAVALARRGDISRNITPFTGKSGTTGKSESKSMSLLIICALENELNANRLPIGCNIVYAGVGKINAALATYEGIKHYTPSLVVNYGTAGKIQSSLQGLYEVASVIQGDMCAMPLEPRGVTPFDKGFQEHFSGFQGVKCSTQDSFVTSIDPWLVEHKVHLVEMELFAIASVCVRLNTPWRAFKYITDDVNDNSHTDWVENAHKGEELFLNQLTSILPHISL
jgi:adenosylhomocysteine nucleosidase